MGLDGWGYPFSQPQLHQKSKFSFHGYALEIGIVIRVGGGYNMDIDKKALNRMNDDMENVVRPCTPSESLVQSIKEMIFIQQGKLLRKTWKDYLKEQKEKEK